ncbi:endonuclease domain-containing protein [Cellulomonas endophytica]|uniref:endonuclease domain-containing protein n=1 Tax=Cellulomonas endophytica TaxID=2494735 RepID=UPI0010103231|nr:DUF559 domain-containing protein [Cellulomonas endophytica]
MDAVGSVLARGGAARWAQLAGSTTHARLVAAVGAGALTRPAPGLYVVPGTPPDVVAAAAVGGVRSCATAAVALGLDVLTPPARPHVTAPRGSRRTWPGCTVHRRDVLDLDGCTDVLTTVLDAARCLPWREALVPVESALRLGRVAEEELVEARRRLHVQDPRRRLLARSDACSGSALESVARADLLDEGYRVRSQVWLPPAGRVDLLVDDWLVLEVDGWAFHGDPGQRSEDLRRDAELTRHGYVVLRFSYAQVVHRRGWWLGVVRDVHTSGRPRFVL